MRNNRYLSNIIQEFTFSAHKMTFISGPRQCGKTTFSKYLLSERGGFGHYWNWDDTRFRKIWTKSPHILTELQQNDTKTPLLILDEIHKAKLWKRTLKGIFDTLQNRESHR